MSKLIQVVLDVTIPDDADPDEVGKGIYDYVLLLRREHSLVESIGYSVHWPKP